MALTSPFYHALIRKYVTLFGYIFDDMRIERFDSAGNETELISVPITYGPKDKMMARVIEDPTITRQAAIQLPVMSFEMTGFQYDPSRKTPTVNRQAVVNSSNPNNLYYSYAAMVLLCISTPRILKMVIKSSNKFCRSSHPTGR